MQERLALALDPEAAEAVAFFAAGKVPLPRAEVQHKNSKQAIIVGFMVID